ncbi:MAG: DEAD/DEAH box helicase [candidate division Zixibacteria bacterium]|nr:DEAD/DEAH box helicase [candidate division Zixibacteria bacterium]
MSFRKFNFDKSLYRALDELGYKTPTPIQDEAIPVAQSGRDMVGTAQTGTGKTAAYLLPILSKLKPSKNPFPEALILTPTRELAIQVGKNLLAYSKYSGHKSTVAYGGSSVRTGREELEKGVQIIVATPGRLLDYLRQGVINLKRLKFVVLDEADRMLDVGFMPDVRRILRRAPDRCQRMLFSATFPPQIMRLTTDFLHNPVKVSIGIVGAPAQGISHKVYPVSLRTKLDLLEKVLKSVNLDSALIFTRTKRQADRVAARLKHTWRSVAVIHGDRTQPQRLRALEGFKNGRYKILVATNIAARGLDISGITHVVNYDTPDAPDDYIHRIGRTARLDAEGDAITLVSPEEYEKLLAIEAILGYKIDREEVKGFAVPLDTIFRQTSTKIFEKTPPVFFGFDPKDVPQEEEGEKPTSTPKEEFGRVGRKKRKRRL